MQSVHTADSTTETVAWMEFTPASMGENRSAGPVVFLADSKAELERQDSAPLSRL